MSHSPKYVPAEVFQSPIAALKAGKSAAPEVITAAGAFATGKIVFTNNIVPGDVVTLNGASLTAKAAAAPSVGKIVFTGNLVAGDVVVVNTKTFTCKAAATAVGQFEFNVDTTLALSLASLNTVLNACTDPLVSYAAYTVTDTNTSITTTSKTNNAAFNGLGLASTHVSVVITAPAGGVSVAGATEFDVGGTLALSLTSLAAQANASADVRISIATYSVTDTNTALTAIYDVLGSTQNDIRFSTTHVTAVVTQPHGGVVQPVISLDVEHTQINFATAITASIFLMDGDETQRKTISMIGAGTANITSPAGHLPGTTVNYALNGNDVLVLQFLGGKWRLILNDGAVAS